MIGIWMDRVNRLPTYLWASGHSCACAGHSGNWHQPDSDGGAMSNYPVGVTGNEFPISGPDREWEAVAKCTECGAYGEMLHQSHWSIGIWAFCTNDKCPAYDDGFAVQSASEME